MNNENKELEVSSSKSPETLENSMLNVMPTVSSNTTVTNASTLQGNDSVSDGPQVFISSFLEIKRIILIVLVM